MKQPTRQQTAILDHILATPSNLLVVTAPRQFGLTTAILRTASSYKSWNPHDRLAILARNTINAQNIVRSLAKLGQSNISVIVASTIKPMLDGSSMIRVCGGGRVHSNYVALNTFDVVYIDDAYWIEDLLIEIVDELILHKCKITIGTSGSNVKAWWDKVEYFKSIGFTSLVPNIVRHPKFKEEQIALMGDASYHCEHETHL